MANEYIRKQDAIDEINTNADDLEQNGGIPYAQGARAMAIVVEQMPSADVAPVVHAYWRDTGSGQECSICKEIQYGYDTGRHYCANCGAKMDGDEQDGG